MPHSPQKMHMHPCMCAHATVQKLLCHGNHCKLILSLARASCRLPFAARPAAVSTKSVAQRCLLKKSVQIHASSWRGRRCGVAQAAWSFDCLRWCRPHPVCLWFALVLGRGPDLILHKIPFFSRVFIKVQIERQKMEHDSCKTSDLDLAIQLRPVFYNINRTLYFYHKSNRAINRAHLYYQNSHAVVDVDFRNGNDLFTKCCPGIIQFYLNPTGSNTAA